MKICVGLSGGVDSSVAALLLKRQGHEVFAMFMQNWHDTEGTLHGDCSWEEDRFIAELVARKIGIPFYFIDLSKTYRQRVVDYMFAEYARGRTPNPDVLCNREIKFDAFLEAARKMGAEAVATGHYCRKNVARDDRGRIVFEPDGTLVHDLREGADPNKDQSYFLCQLSQEQLRRAVFPIGDLTKAEVRRIAAEADLPSADKKDSQGICFVGKVDLPVFLKQQLAPKEGTVVEVFDRYYDECPQWLRQREILQGLMPEGKTAAMTTPQRPEEKILRTDGPPLGDSPFLPDRVKSLSEEDLQTLSSPFSYAFTFETETYRSGKKHSLKTRLKPHPYAVPAGRHDGAQFYTIGQRKGLGIGGRKESLFIIATDTTENIVYVGEGQGHRGLYRSCVRIAREDQHWLRPDRVLAPGETRRCRVRIRYRQPLQGATLIGREDALYILFDTPQRGISAGQFAVWYEGDALTGSGVM